MCQFLRMHLSRIGLPCGILLIICSVMVGGIIFLLSDTFKITNGSLDRLNLWQLF